MAAVLENLRVSDVADLRTEATNFQTHADDLRKVTGEMLTLIGGTLGVWRGDAQKSYTDRFADLSDDMDRLYNLCSAYSTDLIDIANKYEEGETDNISKAQALSADIIMEV